MKVFSIFVGLMCICNVLFSADQKEAWMTHQNKKFEYCSDPSLSARTSEIINNITIRWPDAEVSFADKRLKMKNVSETDFPIIAKIINEELDKPSTTPLERKDFRYFADDFFRKEYGEAIIRKINQNNPATQVSIVNGKVIVHAANVISLYEIGKKLIEALNESSPVQTLEGEDFSYFDDGFVKKEDGAAIIRKINKNNPATQVSIVDNKVIVHGASVISLYKIRKELIEALSQPFTMVLEAADFDDPSLIEFYKTEKDAKTLSELAKRFPGAQVLIQNNTLNVSTTLKKCLMIKSFLIQ